MDRQREILGVFKGDVEIVLSKAQIISKGCIWYYANTKKHVGDTLTRMVRNGSLERVKKGYYRLGKGIRNENKAPNPNQTQLKF